MAPSKLRKSNLTETSLQIAFMTCFSRTKKKRFGSQKINEQCGFLGISKNSNTKFPARNQ